MKISELIFHLENIKRIQGDVQVHVTTPRMIEIFVLEKPLRPALDADRIILTTRRIEK